MVSYEVSYWAYIDNSSSLYRIAQYHRDCPSSRENLVLYPLFPLLFLFFISCLAETNRAPFDLPEAEAELVAGYNVEYSSMGFALFFLGEYGNMIVMSSLCSLFFLGGWLPPANWLVFLWLPPIFWFGLKTILFLFLFVWVRAAFPRYRYDQLMRLGWKVFLLFRSRG